VYINLCVIYLFINYLFIYLCNNVSSLIRLPVYLFMYISIYHCIYVFLFTNLSIYLFIYLLFMVTQMMLHQKRAQIMNN
jgi:hypothetical protein